MEPPFTEFRKINLMLFSTKSDNILKIGIVISCRQENTCNATILKTDPFGVARQKLLVAEGDTIIGINGVSLIDATYTEIVAAIRSSKDTIKILVEEARARASCYLLCCL
jgi:C-terminal processing protease CtpA/Prc